MQMCLFCRIECDFNSTKLLFGFNDIIEWQKIIYWKLLHCLFNILSLSRLNIAHSLVNNLDIILNIIAYIITLFSWINLRLPAHY